MSIDKPLHVQVAEILGWTDCHPDALGNRWWGTVPGSYSGYDPTEACAGDKVRVPLFDEWWSATGPLIQKYGINLSYLLDGTGYWYASWPSPNAQCHDCRDETRRTDRVALIAVCKLIADACCLRKRAI